MEEKTILAGGCFWCTVQPFDTQPRIISVVSSYTGGYVSSPTYEQALAHIAGYMETVEIIFDPTIVSYEQLMDIYWQRIDPTDTFGQSRDRGDNYRPVIFYYSREQKEIAEGSKERPTNNSRLTRPTVTTIELAAPFYPVGEYHQDFCEKDALCYGLSHQRRSEFIEEKWSD